MAKPSNWYYLLPILLSIVGGVIMYFLLKAKDKKMAKNGLILGVALFVLTFVIQAAMNALNCVSSPLSCISPLSMLQR